MQNSVYTELLETEVQTVQVKLGRQTRLTKEQHQVKMSKTVS